jgi:hypothetical protein
MSDETEAIPVKKRSCTGAVCAAFGTGLLTATILPTKFVLVLVAVALIVAGCSCNKC